MLMHLYAVKGGLICRLEIVSYHLLFYFLNVECSRLDSNYQLLRVDKRRCQIACRILAGYRIK